MLINHFKRIISSKHNIIDITYIYPPTFTQTLIIIYSDIIVNKFIPDIIILTNNYKFVGYKHIFNDIIENINQYEKNFKTILNWDSFTSDFDVSLIKAFKEVFYKKYDKIQHYVCYFHFLKV